MRVTKWDLKLNAHLKHVPKATFSPADLVDLCKITLEMTHCEQPNITAAHFRHSD